MGNSRSAAVVAALALVSAGRASAQLSERDAGVLFRAVIVAFADSQHAAMRDIAVDTMNGGRAQVRGPVLMRPRVVPVSAMRSASRALGFLLAGDLERFGLPDGYETCAACGEHKPRFGMLIFGPKLLPPDTARLNVRYTRMLEPEDWSGLVEYRFVRSGRVWRLVRAVEETGDYRTMPESVFVKHRRG